MSINRFLGLELKFNWSTLILIYLVTNAISRLLMSELPNTDTALSCIVGAFVALGVIFSIISHEMGHVVVGRLYGIHYSSITIFALGGVARMTNRIPSPKAEVAMSLAGPGVSLLTAAACFMICSVFALSSIAFSSTNLQILAWAFNTIGIINIVLAVFNLIPAFPLDGGRVLRAIIWMIKDNLIVATRYASYMGHLLGGAMIGSGIIMALGISVPFLGQGVGSGIWICVIGFIIISSARQELQTTLLWDKQ